MQSKNKKEYSEKKRLESIQLKESLLKQKSLVISNSLKQLSQKSFKNNLEKNDDSLKPNKLTLFKDDSDISDFEDAFDVKNQQIKNKSLQFQLHVNDNRFKIDENFLDPEDEVQAPVIEDEKSHSLAILSSIINVKPKQNKKQTFKDIEQLRYDPESRDHKRFEMDTHLENKKNASKDSKTSKSMAQPNTSVPTIVSKERFSEVSLDLKNSFKSTDKFSLSMLFEDEEDDVYLKKDEIITNIPSSNILSKRYISDSSGDEEMQLAEPPIVSNLQSMAEESNSTNFFFTKNDVRLETNFYRTDNIETIKADWLTKRPYYVESYRRRKKHYRLN